MSLALGCLLFFGFIRYTSGLFEKLSGQREFSPFSGWVLAGNTLIMYRHVEHREQDIPPPEMRPLHEMVLQSLDTMPSTDRMPDWGMAYYFTWSLTSPLMIHRHVNLYDNPTNADLKKWASVGGLYKNYAIFLIKKHPLPYVRYYIGQGLDWFIYPVIEFTNEFPEGGSRVKEGVRHWFGYKSTWLSSTSGNLYSLAYIPTVINILHLFMIMGIIAFYFLRIYKKVNTLFRKSIMLAGIYWLANFLFMVVSAPIMLRYHLSIMIVDIAFVPVVWECIYRYMAAKTPQIQPTL
ncbi:MAG TPA: hypothetical protein VHD83_05845 [Puia sp.]|nr:hypothetical protein [Puia sp.]